MFGLRQFRPAPTAPEPAAAAQTPFKDAFLDQPRAQPGRHARRDARKAASAREARLEGFVIDILSLAPIANAELIFTDLSSAKAFTATTGADGRYRARLPEAARGYTLRFSHKDYEPKYLETGLETLRASSFEDRKALAQKISRNFAQAESFPALGGDVGRYDFAVVPAGP